MVLKRFFGIFTSKKEDCEKKSERPTTVRLAVEKGYVTEEQACDFEEAISTGDIDPNETHTHMMVDRRLLTESQAQVIAIDVKKEDPQQALSDRFKEASQAMAKNKKTAEAVGTKTAGIRLVDIEAMKNKV